MIMNFIKTTLNSNIAPMVHVMMCVSITIGFIFATGLLVSGSESILYHSGVLVHRQLWGLLLFATALTAEVGFISDKDRLISIGGLSGFCAWLFACIALLMESHWYVLITVAILHLLFHGYVVLATAVGAIRRRPINK